jgi:serine protease Do
MRYPSYCAAILAVAFLTPFASAQDSPKKEDLRSNDPIVKAVRKNRAGIVAIRVPRPGEKDMIGSGLIFHESGLIVTNRHVTGGKKFVKVRLHDDTDLTGEVVMADTNLDLAIVQIESKNKLHALTFGPVDDLMVGEPVLAIGNPFGYEATVSRGIISAINRKIHMPNDYLMTGLIQHDAPINPGNSGGPLVNINAEVIGINVAMRDGAQNIAFAINAATVKGFVNQYLKKVASAEHGLKVDEKVIAETGDRQRVVVKNAAAHQSELKSGDEILAVGDLKIANTVDVERALWHKQPGQQIPLRVSRQGREITVTLTLTAASQGAGQVAAHAVATNVRSASDR